MIVEQIFYGRGPDGYAILGSSVPSCGLTDQVLELCQSVGTPGFEREDDNQPFLLQKVCGANVLMVCGRNGDIDPLGRKTLFFHAVVVPATYAKEQKISAADLYRAGVFSPKCLDGKLSGLVIDGVAGEQSSGSSPRFMFPAVFSCRRANNLALVSLLRGHLVGTNWVTMCWRVMAGFEWVGLDESWNASSVPADYAVYDGEGKLQRAKEDRSRIPESHEEATRSTAGVKNSIALCAVGALVGLGIGWIIWGNASSKADADMTACVRAEVESDVVARLRAEIEAEVRQKVSAEVQTLKAQAEKPLPVFDERWRIMDFKKEMAEVDEQYKSAVIDHPNALEFKNARAFFKKLENYVDFVNEHFNQKQKEKK